MASPIIAAAHKPSPFSDTGLTFYDDAGNVFIHEVQSGGLFESTPLQAGMKVISINNTSTAGMTSGAVSKMIDGTEGMVTILAQSGQSPYATATAPVATAPPPPMYAPTASPHVAAPPVVPTPVVSAPPVVSPPPVIQAQLVEQVPAYGQHPIQPVVAQQQPVVQHQIVIQQQEPTVTQKPSKPVIKHTGPAPPPGLPEGGIWRDKKYRGCATWAWSGVSCFFFLVPFCLLCKLDKKTVYQVNGKCYTKSGKRL